MKNLMKVLRISGCFLFSILLLNRCTSSDQNTSKNVHSVDTVLIRQMQFQPAVLNVKIGDTVVWINKGIVDHNVTEEKNRSWTSDSIRSPRSVFLFSHIVVYYSFVDPDNRISDFYIQYRGLKLHLPNQHRIHGMNVFGSV